MSPAESWPLLTDIARGTRVDVVTDPVLAGQAAQYGRSACILTKVSRFMVGRVAESLKKQMLPANVSDP